MPLVTFPLPYLLQIRSLMMSRPEFREKPDRVPLRVHEIGPPHAIVLSAAVMRTRRAFPFPGWIFLFRAEKNGTPF
jgi:hypothetical protein